MYLYMYNYLYIMLPIRVSGNFTQSLINGTRMRKEKRTERSRNDKKREYFNS